MTLPSEWADTSTLNTMHTKHCNVFALISVRDPLRASWSSLALKAAFSSILPLRRGWNSPVAPEAPSEKWVLASLEISRASCLQAVRSSAELTEAGRPVHLQGYRVSADPPTQPPSARTQVVSGPPNTISTFRWPWLGDKKTWPGSTIQASSNPIQFRLLTLGHFLPLSP